MAQRAGVLSFIGPLLGIAVFVYALLCVYLYFMQERIIFYPNIGGRELQASPADIGLEYESVS